ncbi:MAG: hypothetical protein OXN83_03875 [Oligoflexia bacterium]|nr:hypothetical protein [Oligoflexia bacterium]
MAVITFYLQFKGNRTIDLISNEAEKISITQNRIEFFQVKNQLIDQIQENKKIPKESRLKMIEGIDFIFENKYAYIVHRDKTGKFPEIDPDEYHYNKTEKDFDDLKNKLIKVQFVKESKKKYALPLLENDFVRQFYMEKNIIKKGLKEIGYFWKNKRIEHFPSFILKIEEIPKNQEFIRLSDKQIYSGDGFVQEDYYLLPGYLYIFTFFEKENSWFITFDNVSRAYNEHVEINFVPFNYIKDLIKYNN